jgi:hypothetical protein
VPVKRPDADAGGRGHLVHPGVLAGVGELRTSGGEERLSISGGVSP